MTPTLVVSELRARFRRARALHAAAGRVAAVEVFERLLVWLETNADLVAPPR